MRVRIVIEYDADQLSLEDINAMVENFKRNLYPKPKDVYFEKREDWEQ